MVRVVLNANTPPWMMQQLQQQQQQPQQQQPQQRQQPQQPQDQQQPAPWPLTPARAALHDLHDIINVPPHLRPTGDACLRPSELHRLMDSAFFEPAVVHLEHMFLQFGDDPIKPTEMGALHSVARPPGLRIEARSAAEARAADHVLELTAASSPAKEERPALSDVDSPAFTAAGSWRPTAPARGNADPHPTSARVARKRR